MKKDDTSKWGVLLATCLFCSLVMVVPSSAQISQTSVAHVVNLGVREVAMVACSQPDTVRLEVDGDRDGTLRLQYTAVNAADARRTILVSWGTGSQAPSGTSLRILVAGIPAGCGQAGIEVMVSDLPVGIITDIPTCTTGRGSSGALVEYRLSLDDASRLVPHEATMATLIFTISEGS